MVCGAERERADRLGAADPIDLVDAGQIRGEEHQRVDRAVRRRDRHHEALDPGDPRRQRAHQDRARIGGGAARDVDPDRRDRPPAQAELDPEIVLDRQRRRQLPAVERGDPCRRQLQRLAQPGGARCDRARDLVRAQAQLLGAQVLPVEGRGVREQRRIALVRDPREDRLDLRAHVDAGRARAADELREGGGEVRRALVEPSCHVRRSRTKARDAARRRPAMARRNR